VIVEDITQPRSDGTPGSVLYSIPFAPSARPPWQWEELFAANWNHPARYTTMNRPRIASVHGTTIEEVERYHRDTHHSKCGYSDDDILPVATAQRDRLLDKFADVMVEAASKWRDIFPGRGELRSPACQLESISKPPNF
jgi:hypothetical protein